MPAIGVQVSGDRERFARLHIGSRPVLHTTADWEIDALRKGMASGATSLMLAIPVEAGLSVPAVVLAETSLTAWMMASSALYASFADELDRPGFAILSPAARAALGPRFAESIRRAIPTATAAQAAAAAEMLMDAVGAGD